jgi:hypothetical protein
MSALRPRASTPAVLVTRCTQSRGFSNRLHRLSSALILRALRFTFLPEPGTVIRGALSEAGGKAISRREDFIVAGWVRSASWSEPAPRGELSHVLPRPFTSAGTPRTIVSVRTTRGGESSPGWSDHAEGVVSCFCSHFLGAGAQREEQPQRTHCFDTILIIMFFSG